jgi:hypothetical protein
VHGSRPMRVSTSSHSDTRVGDGTETEGSLYKMANADVVPTIPTPDLWRVYQSEDGDTHMAIFSTAQAAHNARSKATTALCGVTVTTGDTPWRNGEPLRVCEACKARARQRRVVTESP